jgi:hypothetical protein
LSILHRFAEAKSALELAMVHSQNRQEVNLINTTRVVMSIVSALEYSLKKDVPKYEDEIDLLELKAKKDLIHLKKLVDQGIEVAVQNYNIITNNFETTDDLNQLFQPYDYLDEKHHLDKIKSSKTKVIVVSPYAILNIHEEKGRFIYEITNKRNEYYYFSKIASIVVDKKKINNGITFGELLTALGKPKYMMPNRQGLALHYPEHQIFILTNESNIITSIICYTWIE